MIVRQRGIADGRSGTISTLREMDRLVERGKRNPRIRAAMIHEALAGIPERSPDREIPAVFEWVQRRYRYTKDPHGVELVQDADITLGLHPSTPGGYGDCDDAVIALRSALEQIGYPTRSRVLGQSEDSYAHVVAEVRHPRRGWIPLDPTAKHQPMGWEPPHRASESYPMNRNLSGFDTAPSSAVADIGLDPLWLYEDADSAIRQSVFHRRPAAFDFSEWASPHALRFERAFRTRVAPGQPIPPYLGDPFGGWDWGLGCPMICRRSPGNFTGLGDLAADYGPDADAAAIARYKQKASSVDWRSIGWPGRSQDQINWAAHYTAHEMMEKYGGGAVLKGSKLPPPNGVWRHDPEAMCGPAVCYDITNIAQHPWIQNEDWDTAMDAVANFLWYPVRGWGRRDRQNRDLGQWDETGGVIQYAMWLAILDVTEDEIPNLPAGYVTDLRWLAEKFLGQRIAHMKRRVKKKKAGARTLTYATIGVGAIATALSLGALGPVFGATAGTVGSIVGSVGGAVGMPVLKAQLTKEVSKLGVMEMEASQQESFLRALSTTASAIVKGDPTATTGVASVDNILKKMAEEAQKALEAERAKQAVELEKAKALVPSSSPAFDALPLTQPIMGFTGGSYPGAFLPDAAAPSPTPASAGIPGWAIGLGAAAVGAVVLLLVLKK